MRLLFLLAVLAAGAIHAQVAPDPTVAGGVPVTSSEYKFAAGFDPHVPSTLPTELWARV